MTTLRITPVILCGGSGTRLWPMCSAETPKHFLSLMSGKTMFAETYSRVTDPARFTPPLIVANARHEALIKAQLESQEARLLLEPMARNTAPAIALAALADPDGILLVMPSDHVILDVPAFHAAIDIALSHVEQDWLVTFGIAPDGPEIGYGYIQSGNALAQGVHQVRRFVEKPDRAHAEAMLAGGDYVWNGGIFMFRSSVYLGALGQHAPDMLRACQKAMAAARHDGIVIHPERQAFAASPSDSIDYAVMEKAAKENEGRVAMVPVQMGWSDVGSWDALAELAKTDAEGNALQGDVIAIDTRNCMVRSDGIRIATIGLEDIIVIASGNDILIIPKGRAQDVKQVVEKLKGKQKADSQNR
jgi:mannose-1-phosphate guanylyltransferase/mannose-1-phosphate guanylyltransferase/mannose-6-phosphate isomerase